MRIGFVSLFLTASFLIQGCNSETRKESSKQESENYSFIDQSDPFAIPDVLYALQSYGDDVVIFHPAGFLESLSILPENECDKEKLRRLVIAVNMYSLDEMNQTYYFNINSSGARVIEKSFPEIKNLYGEGGNVINTGVLSDYLRGVRIDCAG